MVKVPATAEGLPAITTLTSEGICVNVTLIFSLARYAQVMDAWLAGLEQRSARGEPIEAIESVASFFVSRVDTKVDQAIEERAAKLAPGSAERRELESYRGHTAIANARLAYQSFRETIRSKRFKALAGRGARPQRPLWASTSTKNPAYRDVMYVEELIGPDTVDTMPPQTLDAFNDHGVVEVRVERDLDQARRLFERLPALGVPVEPLIGELEEEGVQAFAKSYDALIAALEAKRREMVAARGAGS
jgi:transaldolase